MNERRNLFSPFSQRRDIEADDEAIEQVFAEASVAHVLVDVRVRGGNHPDVHVDRTGFAQRVNFTLFEKAQ